MLQRINLDATQKPVREFIQDLGAFRHPIELVSAGKVVARLTAPTELSDLEKQRILKKGRAVVARARSRTKGTPASEIQRLADDAVREVRSRHVQRGR